MSVPGFTIALLLVYICAFGVQCLAFFFLWLQRKQKRSRNQRIIITSLCLGESIYLMIWIVRFSREIHSNGASQANVIATLEHLVRLIVATHYTITMHGIAVDRFLEVYLHLKYKALVTRRLILILVAISWIMGGVFGAVFVTLSKTAFTGRQIDRFAFHFFFVTDLSFLTLALCIYTYLYVKYRQMKASARRNNPFLANSKAHFLAPLFIVFTNVVFQNTASFLSMFNYLSVSSSSSDSSNRSAKMLNVRHISLLLFGLGHISDPLIYIIFNPSVAKRIGHHASVTEKRTTTMKRFREESSYAASSYAAPTPLPALVRDEII